jgi:hypothetical protein
VKRLVLIAVVLSGCGSDGSGTDGPISGDAGAHDAAAAHDAGGGGDGASNGDVFQPWAGGPDYYKKWPHGPSSDPNFFPIAVWLQSPPNAAKYQAIGINTFIGLYNGPTDQDLTTLASVKMPAICDQAVDWQKHLADPTIIAWQQGDEPDNAQSDGKGGYLPCIDPTMIQSIYQTFNTNDGTRPVYLNLGQGVAYEDWVGRGDCYHMDAMYPEYAKGADILSFDIYPVNNTDGMTHGNLWYVALGVDRLRMFTGDGKPVWNWIETTQIDGSAAPDTLPTPSDTRAEVWMSLIHGSRGIGYFVHEFNPFTEAGLLAPANQAMHDAVKALNAQVTRLAPVLNTQPLANGATVDTGDPDAPVDIRVARYNGALYIFAAAMRAKPATATFTVRQGGNQSATVIDENRTLPLTNGIFKDQFDGYAVHLYRIP